LPKTDYLQGALDLLILRTLALAPNHGWGIQQRIRQVTTEMLTVSQGSLYPALHGLEAAGLVASEMAASENNRRARIYQLTAAGRKRRRRDRGLAPVFARHAPRAAACCSVADLRRTRCPT